MALAPCSSAERAVLRHPLCARRCWFRELLRQMRCFACGHPRSRHHSEVCSYAASARENDFHSARASNLHNLHTNLQHIGREGKRAWKRRRLLICDGVFDVAAVSCWSFACVCVCDISGLKNPRDWVGGKELKLQVFY